MPRQGDGSGADRARKALLGSKLDREALAGLVENGPYELKRFRLDEDVHISKIADDVAVIAYKVSEEMVVDGELKKLDAFDTSL